MPLKQKNIRFFDAVEYLKNQGISNATVYKTLKVGRGRFNSMKQHLTFVTDQLEADLQREWPETKHFFNDNYVSENELKTLNPEVLKDKYIHSMEERIKLLKEQLSFKQAIDKQNELLEKLMTLYDEKKQKQ